MIRQIPSPLRDLSLGILLALAFSSAPVFAAFERPSLGARSSGLSGAFSALADDAWALQWNPAGLVGLRSPQLDMSYLEQYGLIGYSAVLVAKPTRFGGWGFGLISSDDREGLYQEREWILAGAYAWRPTLSLGMGIRALSSRATLGDVRVGGARGISVDLAGEATLIEGRLRLALTLPHLLARVAYHRESLWRGPEARYHESPGREVRLGLAWSFDVGRPIQAVAEWSSAGSWRFGGECQVARGVFLRTGIQLGSGLDQGWSLGFGYQLGPFQLDYAYASGRFDLHSSQMSLRFYLGG